MKTVLITGAAGNIGNKLRQDFQGRYDLRLLDIDPRGDKEGAGLRRQLVTEDARRVRQGELCHSLEGPDAVQRHEAQEGYGGPN